MQPPRFWQRPLRVLPRLHAPAAPDAAPHPPTHPRVPDLRGNGRAQRPSWWDRKTWWTVRGGRGEGHGGAGGRREVARSGLWRATLPGVGVGRATAPAERSLPSPPKKVDEHLLIDAPAVIEAVLAATGARQLHWVGHSMGGMLAVGAVSRGLPCARALRSLVLLASGCFGAGSWHGLVGPLLTRLAAAGFHAGHVVPLLASLRGPLAPVAWATRALFYVRGNVEPAVARKLLGSFLSFIPSGVVAQFMGSLNSPLGIASADGAWNYADPKVLAHCELPVFGINGGRDLFCPAAGGEGEGAGVRAGAGRRGGAGGSSCLICTAAATGGGLGRSARAPTAPLPPTHACPLCARPQDGQPLWRTPPALPLPRPAVR
jgi:pimeloyl-ACP methyl ester carboxylesterase